MNRSRKTKEIMDTFNLESVINESFMRMKGLISLDSTDEGNTNFPLEEYWMFADGFCRGYLNAKGYSYD